MPLPLLAIPALKMAAPVIGSALAGLFGNRSQKTKQTNSYRRVTTPEQDRSLGMVMDYVNTGLNTPDAGTAPIRAGAVNKINARYAAMPGTLKARTAGTGMGKNARNQDFLSSLEARRSGEVAGFDNNLASLIMQQRNLAAQTGMQIAGANWGSDSTGTNTQPGNMIGGALNGGLSMLAAMSAMRQIMGGGGAGGFSGYDDSIAYDSGGY
jgi:hypothetical protein